MTILVGILNTTPDSFSDGGNFLDASAAVDHARQLVSEGAAIIDIGGESTRPGSIRVTPEEEQRRILEIVRRVKDLGVTVSVDTVNASTAAAALAAGADIINDVSGGLHDPQMLKTVAKHNAGFIAGHWRGFPKPDNSRSDYMDVVAEVIEQLQQRAAAARQAGIAASKIVLDPGLGFDKTPEQCWRLLRALPRLQRIGYPLLIGASRKRMVADLIAQQPGRGGEQADRQGGGSVSGAVERAGERDLVTALITAACASYGVWGVRVHNVAASQLALAVARETGTANETETANEAETVARTGTANETGTAGQTAAGSWPAEELSGDTISLTGLRVFAHHGVLAEEKRDGQTFLIDAVIHLNTAASAASDELKQTVNYADLAVALKTAAAEGSLDLIETLAHRLADVALSFSGVESARITVNKPDAPIPAEFLNVAVTITKHRRRAAGAGQLGESS
ncbi:dihydropteroate synthase [Leucobacter sp. OH1287]|uniref:dihydropteroate synthase n=1 Tax=Leucobacter sp. OH1287 TaxID=2491049 RepID=UPI000F5FB26B|nr:dihydropteroate synthase [Leucobacter sp. OH1287]RRD61313.1 dihydropteroate synthase [Leucobacter sp. OH1287]